MSPLLVDTATDDGAQSPNISLPSWGSGLSPRVMSASTTLANLCAFAFLVEGSGWVSLLHIWTADDGSFNVSLSQGGHHPRTFENAGEFSNVFAIHPSMVGSVTVEG